MAKLVDVFRNEKQKLGRRQLPLQIDENLTVSRSLHGLGSRVIFKSSKFCQNKIYEIVLFKIHCIHVSSMLIVSFYFFMWDYYETVKIG